MISMNIHKKNWNNFKILSAGFDLPFSKAVTILQYHLITPFLNLSEKYILCFE